MVELPHPFLVAECGKSAAGCAGATEHVDEDVDAAELLEHRTRHPDRALGRRKVGGQIVHTVVRPGRRGASCGRDPHSSVTERLHYRGTYALRAPRHERALIGQLQIEGHGVSPMQSSTCLVVVLDPAQVSRGAEGP